MLNTDISFLANLDMECECGRQHTVPVKKIESGSGAIDKLPEILSDFKGARVFLTGDNNTMPLAGDKVRKMLKDNGCEIFEYIFTSEKHLILNEELAGSMLIRMPKDTALIVTIGSGTLNDLSRVISSRCGIPYIIIGTAPSMDGYASAVSPIVMDGGKHSVQLGVPYAIIADTDIMKTAPDEMLSSGVGDILGKYVALNDWQLARHETDEFYCPYIAGLVDKALDRCVKGISGLKSRSTDVIKDMADTLIMSGAAISMHGTSRPASGCEHQLAHYWEVALLGGEHETPLHGNFVGLGTRVACLLYELASSEFDLKFDFYMPKPVEIENYMNSIGDYSSLSTLGVTSELLYDSFFHATAANGRYTLISFLEQKGRLEHYARLSREAMRSAVL